VLSYIELYLAFSRSLTSACDSELTVVFLFLLSGDISFESSNTYLCNEMLFTRTYRCKCVLKSSYLEAFSSFPYA